MQTLTRSRDDSFFEPSDDGSALRLPSDGISFPEFDFAMIMFALIRVIDV